MVARFGNLSSSLVPIKDDTFVANFLPGEATLTFKGDKHSGFTEFTMLGKAFIRAQ